jgi:branched-chain amino acid transport system substrate-binding protein
MHVRKKSILLALLALLIGALALTAAGCGGDDDDGGGGGTDAGQADDGGGGDVEPLPSSSCGELETGEGGGADVIVASDLPLQGSSRTQTIQMTEAIRLVLEQNEWRAGDVPVGYQSCDDSTAQAGKWDSGKCSQNAKEYANNESVVGVIGTFNSGCAQIIIPVLNRAPGGGVGMVSPANTYVCLTVSGPGCEETEPDKYYPSGKRNYIRMVAHDAYQGAAVAQFMQDQGVTSVFILNDKESYGLGVAQNLRNAAESLGLEVAGFEAWDPKASSYEGLMRKIGGTGADAVFLGGLIDENGAQVIKDKVAVLGPNDGEVKLFAPDGFTTQATIDEAGQKNAAGMYSSVAGVPPDELTGTGAEFIEAFEQELGGDPIDPYAAYGAQAMQVVLDAIERAGTERGAVAQALFETDVQGGILGDFQITPEGDPTAGPITIYQAAAEFEPAEVITPEPDLVEAAKGEAR